MNIIAAITQKRKHRIEHWKMISLYLVLYDIIAVNFSYALGLLMRFDFQYSRIPGNYLHAFLCFAPFYTIFSVLAFRGLHLYNSLWRFASFSELNRCLAATGITAVFHILGITLLFCGMPLSYYIIGPVIQFLLVTGVRFSYRFVNLERARRRQNSHTRSNVMVIGAGAAGQMLLKEMTNTKMMSVKPCCVIDDNSNKWGRFMEGVKVVGGREEIPRYVEEYQIDQILFAVPTATPKEKKEILDICKGTKCDLKILPGVYQLANGEVALSKMRPVDVEDLLGREPISVNMKELFQHIKGKTILVTGGGGSIGSELCRQVAAHEPKQLILFDIYENNAYEIQQELKRRYPALDLVVLIGSVRDSRRISQVIGQYRPDILYHAAAHKHVPLMEDSPNEAIKNNVIGTYKTAYAALKYGVARFVLISTDKAVNPTNVMGASKRLCEMVVQSMDAVSRAGRPDLLPCLHDHADDLAPGYPAQAIAGGFTQSGADDPTRAGAEAPIQVMTEDPGQAGAGGLTPAIAEGPAQVGAGDPSQAMAGGPTQAGAGEPSQAMDPSAMRKGSGRIEIGSTSNKGRTGTQFVAVRFGNVLGSNGSVIPLFRKQIAEGGPVTVTDPEIERFFMTIPEAVSLVLQAGVYAWGGEIFVLDMGEPVKIDTLARNLIRLSGYEPDVDIPIQYTGLRPGEKLYEEKLMAEEGLKKTDNNLIYIGKPVPFDPYTFLCQLKELATACYNNSDDIVEKVAQMVPTFHPSGARPDRGA